MKCKNSNNPQRTPGEGWASVFVSTGDAAKNTRRAALLALKESSSYWRSCSITVLSLKRSDTQPLLKVCFS